MTRRQIDRVGQTLKEEGDVDLQRARDLIELGGADPVGAALVFLNLLKGYTNLLKI